MAKRNTHHRQPKNEYSRSGVAVVVPVYNEEYAVLSTLHSLSGQKRSPYKDDRYIFVDNRSTDDTANIIDYFRRVDEAGRKITLLEETKKGTGAASDRGFRHAIDQEYDIIARTDGDTQVAPNWLSVIDRSFSENYQLQIMGGRTLGLRDEHYRAGDDWQYMMGVRIVYLMRSLDAKVIIPPVLGHNMAVRSSAYDRVDGFKHTKIENTDEDIDLLIRIVKEYGTDAATNNKEMVVYSSMRRIRDLGRLGTILHYSFPNRRLEKPQTPDVR